MNLGEFNKEFRFLIEKYQTKFSNKEILNSIKSNIDSLNSGPNQDEIVNSYNNDYQIESYYQMLFQNSPNYIYITDLNGIVIDANQSMLERVGLSLNDLRGTKFQEFYAGDNLNKILEVYKKILSGESVKGLEVKVKNVKGQIFIYQVDSVPIFENGNISMVLNIARDITELKRIREKLEDSEKKFRNIFESIPRGMFFYSLEDEEKLVFSGFNPAAEKVLKVNCSKFMGKTIEEAFPPLVNTNIPSRYKSLAKEGGIWSWNQVDYEYEKIKGVYEVVAFQTSPNKMVTSFTDITEKIEIENKVKESEKILTDFIESAPDHITIWDSNINLLKINKAARTRLGVENNEVLGKNMIELDPEFISSGRYDAYTEVIKTGKSITYENIKSPTPLGERYYNIKAFKVGNGLGVLGIDVHERIEAEKALRESEKKFRAIIEHINEVFYINDLKSNLTYLSPGSSKLLGYNREEFLEGSFEEWLTKYATSNPINIKAIEMKKNSLQTGEKSPIYNLELKHKNGSKAFLEVNESPMFDENGDIAGLIGVVRDITERKKTEQKLKESEEKFRKLFEDANDAIFLLDDLKVVECNNKTKELFGCDEISEVIGQYIWDLSPPKQPDGHNSKERAMELNKRIKDGTSLRFYWQHLKKDGTPFDAEVATSSLNVDNKIMIQSIVRDITEKLEIERELRKLNNLKSELLRRTSHELKTPLVSIKGFSDLLLNVYRDNLDSYVVSTLINIRDGVDRLENLIKDILKSSELESGKVELRRSKEDLSFLIKKCVEELSGFAELRSHKIGVDIGNEIIVLMDKAQIHEVISNLLTNAIKYTPSYGEINISSEIREKSVLISISDNGIGFSEKEKENLFSQFGKVERYGEGFDIITEGSGLGLYISKKIIDLHGGRIWLQSGGKGKGSTFSFSLPLN